MVQWYHRATLACVGILSMIWFGLTLTRLTLVYNLFEPGTQVVRNISIEHQLEQLRLAENIAIGAWFCYALLCIMSAVMTAVFRRILQSNGYVLMASIFMGCTLLWQSFLVPIELQLVELFPSRWAPPPIQHHEAIMTLVNKRFFTFSAADFLSLLTASTIIATLIVRPLTTTHGQASSFPSYQ